MGTCGDFLEPGNQDFRNRCSTYHDQAYDEWVESPRTKKAKQTR